MLRPTLTRWVRPRSVLLALGLALLPLGAVLVAQTATPSSVTRLAASGDVAAGWGRRLEDLQRAGTLRLRSSREDTMIDGRVHDRFDQYAGEVPIFGAQVVRQRSGAGVETVFGDLYPEDLGISLIPRLGAEQALARITALAGRPPIGGKAPELVVLPREDGAFTLTWLCHARVGGEF